MGASAADRVGLSGNEGRAGGRLATGKRRVGEVDLRGRGTAGWH